MVICIVKHHEYRSAAILDKLMRELWTNANELPEPIKEAKLNLNLIKAMITIAEDLKRHIKEKKPDETEEQFCISFMKVKNRNFYSIATIHVTFIRKH